jgi:hypothetical protein
MLSRSTRWLLICCLGLASIVPEYDDLQVHCVSTHANAETAHRPAGVCNPIMGPRLRRRCSTGHMSAELFQMMAGIKLYACAVSWRSAFRLHRFGTLIHHSEPHSGESWKHLGAKIRHLI